MGDFMHDSAKTLEVAILKCKEKEYKCIVYEEVLAKSPWYPYNLTKHGKEVYRNF